MKQVNILNIKVHNINMTQTIKVIDRSISSRKKIQIVTLNPEMIMAAQKDVESANIINHAELVVPDGIGLLWAARFTKQQLSQRVTGVDLIDNIAELANKKTYSIYFLGAEPGIAKKTAQIFQKKYSKFKIAGYSSANPDLNFSKHPQYQFPYDIRITDIKMAKSDPNLKIADKIRVARPDILLVAYGHPKQEKFIARYRKLLNVPVMIGVGGSFDFFSGVAKRAPKLFQKLGLEWLWRLLTQPWRFNRIITAVIRFPLAVLINKLTTKKELL